MPIRFLHFFRSYFALVVFAMIASVVDFDRSSEIRAGAGDRSKVARVSGATIRGTFTTLRRLRLTGPTSDKDLVVYLELVGTAAPTKKGLRAAIAQTRLRFVPHVLLIEVGTKVQILNRDQVSHNVFSNSRCCHLDRDMPKGEKLTLTFDKPGVTTLLCRLHPESSAHIIVVETPYFLKCRLREVSVGDERLIRASFQLEGIPPGEYVLRSWHQKLKPTETRVSIKEGQKGIKVAIALE